MTKQARVPESNSQRLCRGVMIVLGSGYLVSAVLLAVMLILVSIAYLIWSFIRPGEGMLISFLIILSMFWWLLALMLVLAIAGIATRRLLAGVASIGKLSVSLLLLVPVVGLIAVGRWYGHI